ncbi:MAG: HNH endonuclease signature motif containing protein [Planctomycetota bacterium]|jgi:5-methylcytosine-specific restriction protein A
MARKPKRPCRSAGCLGLVRPGEACPKCGRKSGRSGGKSTTPWAATERKWRDSARWRHGLRPAHLAEQPLCVACAAEGKTTVAQHVDHIRPACGNAALFWAPANLQSLCAHHHSQKTVREQ